MYEMSTHSSNIPPSEYQESRVISADLHLTAEEIRMLKQCNEEGIVSRAIPLGFVCGTATYIAIQKGWIKPTMFGTKPLVFFSGVLGFFIGRVSYGLSCANKLLTLPNSTLKQRLLRAQQQASGFIPQERYMKAESLKSPEDTTDNFHQSVGTDLDLPTTSSFDPIPTYPDHMDSNITPDLNEHNFPKYTNSYDDLRKQNRKEYIDRMWDNNAQDEYGQIQNAQDPQRRHIQTQPMETPMRKVMRPSQDPEVELRQKTKYGDVWE